MLSKLSVFFCLPFNKVNTSYPGSSDDKEFAGNVGEQDLIPALGRSPGEGHGNPLQYFCLENPMDREACQATVHGFARVEHDLATKPPYYFSRFHIYAIIYDIFLFLTYFTVYDSL